MTVLDVPVEQVPNSASGRLATMDSERWRAAHATSRALNYADAYREALCALELGLMNNDTLAKLRLLAKAQAGLEKLAGELKSAMETAKNAADNLAAKVIPEIMDAAEVAEFALTTNFKMTIEEKIHASMKKDQIEPCCKFLEEKGFSSIVKRTVSVPFSTKQGKLADKVVKAVEKALGDQIGAVEIQDEKSVHHSTLSAWARRWLQEGNELSTEQMKMFGIFRQRRAKVSEKE